VAKPKALTREQLQSRKEKAEPFTRDVRDDQELAAQIEAESVEDYARHRGIELLYPNERRVSMATVKELNQEIGDLEETIDEATAILEDAYTPEASREDLAEAIGNALDVLSGCGGGGASAGPEEEEEEEAEEEEEEAEEEEGED
jgi:hypothetical protein